MIEYELNDAYKKISNSIESQFHDEIYSKISNRITRLEEPIDEKVSECIRDFGISEDFSIRQRDITEMLDDATYQFRRSIAKRKEEIEELFQSFYIGLKNVVSKDISKTDKTKLLARYVDDLKYNVSSLHNNARNSVEFFDDLDMYFRRRSGNDDFYYEMRTYLNREKEKFVEKYLEEINDVLKSSLKRAQDDIDNYVLPHINKEERKKEEKEQEQANNGAITKKLSDGSIISPYLSLDISNFRTNKEFNNTIASLIHSIMYMDLYRDKKSANNLTKKFAESISVCSTSEDFNKLDELLKKLSDMGGYASEFYLAMAPIINQNGKDQAIKYLENIKALPVTKKHIDGSITSPYLSVDISNFSSNKELNNTIASLIHYIVYMDLFRSQNAKENLKNKFDLSFSACKTSEDFNKLDELLKKLSDMGGYASKFYLEVSPLIKEKEASCLEIENKESVEMPEEIVQQTEIVDENKIKTDEVKTDVVEDKKEEQPMNNTKKSVYYEISDQFTKGIETIINQKIHFLERHQLSMKLHDISFMQAREMDEVSTKNLNAIAEMYQMKKETREEDSNLLLDNFVAYVENCMKKDYASNVFEDVAKKIMNNNDLWLTFEQMEQINNLAVESKNNFNLYMRNELISMQKETLEKANKYFGIVYPTSNDEVLEENKGHKI